MSFYGQVLDKFSWNATIPTLVWFGYTDDIFFTWKDGEEVLDIVLKSLIEFDPCPRFIYDFSEENIAFFDIKLGLTNGKAFIDKYVKPINCH